ncbi:MAG: PQQ-binding-like beta-propeller repeat protein [Armatimonadetes bacterium]|nr:PQQ-binding-like beta-propeller repeat protein [Armatimonadota bacterium]
MIVALTLALMPRYQGKTSPHPPEFESALLSVRYLCDVPLGGVHYGSDLTPYLFTQTFEPYKGPPTFDPGDTKPLTFTIERLGKKGWKSSGPSDSQTMAVLADEDVVIPYQRWDYRGFTVLNAKTGSKLWSRKPAEEGNHADLSLVDGVIYQWEAGRLSATEAPTGHVIWERPVQAVGRGVQFSPIRVASERLYAGLEIDGKACLLCFDARSGGQLWKREVGVPSVVAEDHELPDFVVNDQYVVGYEYSEERVGGLQKQSLYCLTAVGGGMVWQKPLDEIQSHLELQVNQDTVFLGGVRSPSFLLNLADGSQIAKLDLVWGKLFGSYVLDVDDQSELVIMQANTGQRIGLIHLTKNELWTMNPVGSRLLISHGFESPPVDRVYEITTSR